MKSVATGTAKRIVKAAFRSMGIEISRYSSSSSTAAIRSNRLPDIRRLEEPGPFRSASFVLVASNHGTLIVNRNDFSSLEQGDAFGVGYELLSKSSYAPTEIRLALSVLAKRKAMYGPGVVAIDCGANIGVHTIEWARQMGGWGTVIAIEAQERIFYALCGNITINNCMNARAIWAAAGARTGTIDIPIPNYDKPGSFGSLELRESDRIRDIGQDISYSGEESARVDIIAIDDLDLPRLDFLKIDIEGMEIEALVGAEKTIRRCNPALIVEIIKSDVSEIQSYFNNIGYVCYRFDINILAIHETDPLVPAISTIGGILRIND